LNFFKNSWNYFDAFIVIIALIPNTGYLTVLRALRILRLVRLIRIFPRMTFLIASLKDSVSGIVSVFLFISLFFSLFSFIAFNLFKTANVEYFGTMGLTIQTMFQIMSSEGWEQVIRPIEAKIPYSNLFFITYILLMKFTLLNLFLGLILNSMQAASRRENRMAIEKLSTNLEVATELETKIEVTLEKKVDVLMSEIQTLRKLLAEKSK
jgi:voltage-gated sodium channel